jgi:hypothetical protein
MGRPFVEVKHYRALVVVPSCGGFDNAAGNLTFTSCDVLYIHPYIQLCDDDDDGRYGCGSCGYVRRKRLHDPSLAWIGLCCISLVCISTAPCHARLTS